MKLFIDTNIFLSFYDFTEHDLEQIKKIINLLNEKKLNLILTEQIRDEFFRQRESTIDNSIKNLEKFKLKQQIPRFIHYHEGYREFDEKLKEVEKAKQSLIKHVRKQALSSDLEVDKVIESLFQVAETIPSDDSIFELAYKRASLGNPPGKKGSLGDAVNWEYLLKITLTDEGVHLISRDRDFCSSLDKESIHPFLLKEWNCKKKSSIFYYNSLTDFLNKQFPDIKLEKEEEKTDLIEKLFKSTNFETTHKIIAQLKRFAGRFTISEIDDIVSAFISNNQIYMIIQDADIKQFIQEIIVPQKNHIEQSSYEELISLIPAQEN